jgi:hypothetical protein
LVRISSISSELLSANMVIFCRISSSRSSRVLFDRLALVFLPEGFYLLV